MREPNDSKLEFARVAGYSLRMTVKQKVMKAVQSLPDDACYEDAMERLLFLAKIENGVRQGDARQTVAHEKIRQKMKRWLK